MKKILFFLLFIAQIFSQYPDGAEILRKIDENMSANNQIIISAMIIHGQRSSRSITAKSWIQGTEKSFTEYLSPPREKGTKMLKIDDQLWLYSPQSDRIIRIAGHMLRQSLMGSDLSYEDMMEDQGLVDLYLAEIIGVEQINDRDCWIMKLTAKEENLSYNTQKLWVDQEYMIPIRQHQFARSGKLLKTIELSEITQIDERWYPKRMVFKDVLSKGRGTEFIIESIAFDEHIPDYIFSKAALRK